MKPGKEEGSIILEDDHELEIAGSVVDDLPLDTFPYSTELAEHLDNYPGAAPYELSVDESTLVFEGVLRAVGNENYWPPYVRDKAHDMLTQFRSQLEIY